MQNIVFNQEQKSDIISALFEVRNSLPAIPVDSVNSLFGSKYVSLQTLMAIAVPLFQENGILIIQAATCDNTDMANFTMVEVETMLVHVKSGQSMTTHCAVPVSERTAHAAGSSITYARRYAMMCLLGAVPADDDGNDGSKKRKSVNVESDMPF